MYNRNSFLLYLVPFVLLTGVFCANQITAQDDSPESGRQRSPGVDETELGELVSGNTEFAFDLYHAIKGESDNLFYSPYSISVALAMTYAGARGVTEEQMANVLHFTLAQERLHAATNVLDLELASRGEGCMGQDGQSMRLKIANSLWGQDGYPFLSEFLNLLDRNYGAGIRLVDFESNPESCRVTINGWVEEQTEDKIKDLIPSGAIDAMTRLVLANAIYFNAAWAYMFDEEDTADGWFYPLEDDPIMVPMMNQKAEFRYLQGDGYEAVELPYDGEELSMVILLPGEGEFTEFEDALSADVVAGILGELDRREPWEIDVTMPKFELDTDSIMLADVLAEMGMPDAFVFGIADLSGMDGSRDLFISAVIHKAYISVNEAGTEAAAATAVIVTLGMAMEPAFRADRPFIFLIRDNPTGAILFVGRILNPLA